MRASLGIVVVTGTVFVAVACSQTTSPTNPTPAPSTRCVRHVVACSPGCGTAASTL